MQQCFTECPRPLRRPTQYGSERVPCAQTERSPSYERMRGTPRAREAAESTCPTGRTAPPKRPTVPRGRESEGRRVRASPKVHPRGSVRTSRRATPGARRRRGVRSVYLARAGPRGARAGVLLRRSNAWPQNVARDDPKPCGAIQRARARARRRCAANAPGAHDKPPLTLQRALGKRSTSSPGAQR